MPDNRSDSTEQALMQEINASLAQLSDDPVRSVADVDFPVVMRGYDRASVADYVRRVTELLGELAAMRSPDAAVRRALERVGAEVSGILQRAHETAEQITTQARRDADERLASAREQAATLNAEGERRAKELDSETDRIWAERHRIVEDARQLAGQLPALAESAAERFPAEEPPGGGSIDAPDTSARTTAFPAIRPGDDRDDEAAIGPAGEYDVDENADEEPGWEEEGFGREPEEGGHGSEHRDEPGSPH